VRFCAESSVLCHASDLVVRVDAAQRDDVAGLEHRYGRVERLHDQLGNVETECESKRGARDKAAERDRSGERGDSLTRIHRGVGILLDALAELAEARLEAIEHRLHLGQTSFSLLRLALRTQLHQRAAPGDVLLDIGTRALDRSAGLRRDLELVERSDVAAEVLGKLGRLFDRSGHALGIAVVRDEQCAVDAREHAVVHHVAQRHAANRGELRAPDVDRRATQAPCGPQPRGAHGHDADEAEGDEQVDLAGDGEVANPGHGARCGLGRSGDWGPLPVDTTGAIPFQIRKAA
jgi:hypothetical protein